MNNLDRRLHAYSPELADSRLHDRVEAERYADGEPAQVCLPSVPLKPRPDSNTVQDTQLLYGETVRVFYANPAGWAWVQSDWDNYVGWCAADALMMGTPNTPTHRISAVRTPVYHGPSIKGDVLCFLSMNAVVTAGALREGFVETPLGFVWAGHLSPVDAAQDQKDSDFIAMARRFLDLPYIWGGRSCDGVDCSGLIQMAAMGCGLDCPRDSDMQETAFRRPLADLDASIFDYGDLLFWTGHVGIVASDPDTADPTLLHANGHHMAVAEEPLKPALKRITEKSFGGLTSVGRITQ
jgi:cell wall-associated NlpC family hydrolase